MTNPNPSPELLQRARQIVADAKYEDPMFHALVMDGSMDFEMVDFVLAGMAEPQTLPAPGEVERAYVAGFEQGWEYPRGTSPTEAAEEYARGYVASLATVAAVNDEGVARSINDDPVGALAIRLAATANEAEEEHGEWTWREIADAAIRLLSQGGGKARSEGWTEKGREWLDGGAPLATSRSQHEGASS